MTKNNQRNYFRILYVQPDAPIEIVTASYRALMGPLKKHPDRGGNHVEASLINEAYNVLSDPVRREAYMRTYQPAWTRSQVKETRKERVWDASDWTRVGCCPFCRAVLPPKLNAEAQCARCQSPLAEPLQRATPGRELLGRRTGSRTSKHEPAILYPGWGVHPIAVRMRDMSAAGLSVYAGVALPVGQSVRIVGALLDAVALIVSARQREREWLINARLLTVHYTRKAGVFVSETA